MALTDGIAGRFLAAAEEGLAVHLWKRRGLKDPHAAARELMDEPRIDAVLTPCAAGLAAYLGLRLRQVLGEGDQAEFLRLLERAHDDVPPPEIPDAEKSLASSSPGELAELAPTLLETLYRIIDAEIARAARVPESAPW